MEIPAYCPSVCQLSLRELLELQEHPLTEEQAWALCYQLCCLMINEQHRHGSWKPLRLRGAESVLVRKDGTVYLKTEEASREGIELLTEDQAVDYLGRLIYSGLDWGLAEDVERNLGEMLESLIYQMTKLHANQRTPGEPVQPISTFYEVAQVCEARLYSPAKAEHHYRAICSILFAETIDLCQYINKIQNTKKTLQKLISIPENTRVAPAGANWFFSWKYVIDELRKGVRLRSRKEYPNSSTPLPVELSPFEKLLNDIRGKRYTLRKVKTVGNLQRQMSPRRGFMDYLHQSSSLRPVNDRRLKMRPSNEASLHHCLMMEIRSAGKLRPLASRLRRAVYQDSSGPSPNCIFSLSSSAQEDSLSEDLPQLRSFDSEENCPSFEFSDGKLSDNMSSHTDLKFFPALSSSPLDSQYDLSDQRSRSKSLDSSTSELNQDNSAACTSVTLADVLNIRKADMANVMDSYSSCWNKRLCSNCFKRSLFFTWHNICHFCNRVVCPDCCLEMLLPSKSFVNLPVSFFKRLILSHEDVADQNQNFWKARWEWDCSSVPLVLESQSFTKATPHHRLAMKDWYSKELCVGCKDFLLDACDSLILPAIPKSKPTKEI
uniref:Zgc:114123 n=1 Tax=Erpetoichthys calabaricus TaxID=27687 RepID=A0A8C4S930_ERPCA